MTRRLGDFVELVRGTTYKSKLLGLPGPVLLGLGTIQRNGGFRGDKLRTYGGESPEKLLLRPGDIYVSLKDVTQAGDLLGSVARLPEQVALGRLTQDTVRLALSTSAPPPSYLYWLLRTPQYRQYCRAHGTGTTNLGLPREDFLSFEVPELTHSRSMLVDLLETLADKIELNRQMNETLEEMARAIFKSWFVDFDPVRAKIEGRQPAFMDDATAALFPDSFGDSDLGPIPIGWSVAGLGTCLDVLETGKRPKGGVKGIISGVPSVGAESVVGVGKFNYAKTKYVPRDYFESMKRGHIQSRDVLIYKDGGRPGQLVPHVSMFGDGFPFQEYCINEHVYRARGTAIAPQNYLYFSLSSPRLMAEMAMKGTGVAVPGLNRTAMKSLSMIFPREPLTQVFHDFIEPFVARILSNSLEANTLSQLRDLLLPKLLSGKIRVESAAEKVKSATKRSATSTNQLELNLP